MGCTIPYMGMVYHIWYTISFHVLIIIRSVMIFIDYYWIRNHFGTSILRHLVRVLDTCPPFFFVFTYYIRFLIVWTASKSVLLNSLLEYFSVLVSNIGNLVTRLQNQQSLGPAHSLKMKASYQRYVYMNYKYNKNPIARLISLIVKSYPI